MPIPDACIITASDEKQARVFRTLLERRVESGLYPREIDFRVYSDPPAGRAGSGGGTIWALLSLLKDDGIDLAGRASTADIDEALARLAVRRTLVIHAGGEARRLPCFVPEGKIFAPVPAPSSSLLPPVVLDVELSVFLRYPWRDGELVVTSGDALVDFSTDLLNLGDEPLCGFAAPQPFEQGSRHGVFVFDPVTGAVKDYHQKASVEFLSREARIEGTESCAVDIGPVSFHDNGMRALLEVATKDLRGGRVGEKVARGQLPLDLYLEFLTASLAGLDKKTYLSRVSARSRASREELELLFDSFHPCGLAGALVKQASFLHFGSMAEYPAACRELRARGLAPFYAVPHEELVPRSDQGLVLFDSFDTAIDTGAGGVCVEDCRSSKVKCDGDNLLVGLRDFASDRPLPAGFCIDERRLDGPEGPLTLRLVYHQADSFKPQQSADSVVFCGRPLREWLSERGLALRDVFPAGTPPDLYLAELFPAGATAELLSGYWSIPAEKDAWRTWFCSSKRYSISSANAQTDAAHRDLERLEVRAAAARQGLENGGFFSVPAADLREVVRGGLDVAPLVERLIATDEPLLKAYRGAVLRALGVRGVPASDRVEVPFAPRAFGGTLRSAVKLDQIVWARSPVRLDLAGGWTDTPPYTNRYGGAVLNVAVDLNGQSPIQVFVRRTPELRLTFHSIDLGVREVVQDTRALRRYRDPGSPFSLPRAALVLLGLGAGEADGASLEPILKAAGGGLELTLLCAVPKGSGLGTSSILAGTILAALERFYGVNSPRDELFLQVLEMEQMLTTGGGWQDQIGGLVGGVKYIESRPAMKPRPVVHQLDPWMFEASECTRRMTLFYTGVTRLAKGILQDVVDRVNGMERAYLFTHSRIAELAREGREAISLRDLRRLSRIVSESFRENLLIHHSTANDEIDELIAATSPHYEGMKLLGAGGGGFALFISARPGVAETLRSLLADRFENDRARLVDFSLNKRGLEVTVS